MSQTETLVVPASTPPLSGRQESHAAGSSRSGAAALERLETALEAVRRLCPSLAVLAIRWMHVRHPLHHVQEALLQGKQLGAWRRRAAFAWRLGQCVVYAVFVSARLMRLRRLLRRELALLRRQSFDIVARTLCFDDERPADGRDFYFGDLQQRLAQRDVRMLLLCADVSGRLRREFARGQVAVFPHARMPDLCLAPPLAPLKMMGQQLLASWRLAQLRKTQADPLIRQILTLASRECLAPDTALTGLVYWVGLAAVRTWRPKAVVTFYEGQACEPCVWRGTKAAEATCKTVGYQHTVLLPLNLALLHPSEDGRANARPDVVLCLGPRTQAMLRPSHRRSRLVVFGTFRPLPAAAQRHAPRPRVRVILVVPETGILSEAQALFQFMMQAARALPNYRFLFRCHPIMPFDRLRPHLEGCPDEVPNVEVSETASIVDDFIRSSVVLYRGSSSVLYAVLHGLKPVYVRVDRHRDGDPLVELNGWREIVSSVGDLEEVVRRYAKLTDDAARQAWQEAVRYVECYTTAVSDASLEAFLAAIGLSMDRDQPCGA